MASERLPKARDAVGMRVPRPRVAAIAMKLRSRLGRAYARSAPPFGTVIERLSGMIDNKALAVAVELRIPDLLADGPQSAEDLAREAGADQDALHRLLRYLVSRELLGMTGDGRFRNNAVSDVLREDHPWSWRDWVRFFGSDWHWQIWNEAAHSVRTGKAATVAATGHEYFEYVNTVNPAAGDAFNGAMAAGSRVQGLLLRDAYDLTGVTTLCDVGGGTGTVIADLLASNPSLRGILFDRPDVVDAARAVLEQQGVASRCDLVGGDFFESVPAGCDRYTLQAIVHDWDDDAAARILTNVHAAMGAASRALVIEMVVPDHPYFDLAKVFDLEMLILTGSGRERTLAEFAALFGRAGLRLERTIPLPSLFRVFELSVSP